MILDGYTEFGGAHPETAALTNVLAASEVRAPHTDAPFSEALLFGIGGGLGAGYILWEFEEHNIKILVLGFHNQWQYPMRYFQGLCDRINVTITMPEFGSRKAADAALDNALEREQPAVAWVDRAYLPYLQLPEAMKGHIGHIVAVCGKDAATVWVDDRATAPFAVTQQEFAKARGRIGSYKNRLLLVEGVQSCDLPAAVTAGLRACVEHLSSPSDSFSLPALRKWAKMMTDEKNKKGWPKLFHEPIGLYSTLRSTFEGIALEVGDGALRGLYAKFLHEAADITGNERLRDVAALYEKLAESWSQLAEVALPDDVPPLRETKQLLRQRHMATMQGGDAWQETQPITAQLRQLSRQLNIEFPLDQAGIRQLFERMQAQLLAIYDAEKAALAALGEAIA